MLKMFHAEMVQVTIISFCTKKMDNQAKRVEPEKF